MIRDVLSLKKKNVVPEKMKNWRLTYFFLSTGKKILLKPSIQQAGFPEVWFTFEEALSLKKKEECPSCLKKKNWSRNECQQSPTQPVACLAPRRHGPAVPGLQAPMGGCHFLSVVPLLSVLLWSDGAKYLLFSYFFSLFFVCVRVSMTAVVARAPGRRRHGFLAAWT